MNKVFVKGVNVYLIELVMKDIDEAFDKDTVDIIPTLVKNLSTKSFDRQYLEYFQNYIELKCNANTELDVSLLIGIKNMFLNISDGDGVIQLQEAFMDSHGKRPIKVELDADGSILLKKHENVNHMQIYMQSHRLLKLYESTNNLIGMKYEVAKQWFLLVALENRIIFNNNTLRAKFITEAKKQDAIKTRAFLLADIKKYLGIVMSREKDFNFSEYYKSTPFYEESFKIDKRLINMVLPF